MTFRERLLTGVTTEQILRYLLPIFPLEDDVSLIFLTVEPAFLVRAEQFLCPYFHHLSMLFTFFLCCIPSHSITSSFSHAEKYEGCIYAVILIIEGH